MPLTIEDLITDKGKVKLDLSISYANKDFQGVAIGEPVKVLTGTSTSTTLPSKIGETKGTQDIVVGTLGLRYGLSAKAEIYSRASWIYDSSRISVLEEITKTPKRQTAQAVELLASRYLP